MKVRLSKNGDNVLITSFPWNLKLDNETENEFMDRMTVDHPFHKDKWRDVETVDIEFSDLPNTRAQREKWYPDFEDNGEPFIKIDLDWSIKLMPDYIIKRKHIEDMESELDDLLASQDPNLIEVAKIQRQCEKCKDIKAGGQNESIFWAEIAISGLDKRIGEGKPDKPIIRKKLKEKMEELKKEAKE